MHKFVNFIYYASNRLIVTKWFNVFQFVRWFPSFEAMTRPAHHLPPTPILGVARSVRPTERNTQMGSIRSSFSSRSSCARRTARSNMSVSRCSGQGFSTKSWGFLEPLGWWKRRIDGSVQSFHAYHDRLLSIRRPTRRRPSFQGFWSYQSYQNDFVDHHSNCISWSVTLLNWNK